MKAKSIEDLLERVKSWPPGAQGDLAQAVLGIEADVELGLYDEPYIPTDEEREILERRCQDLDDGTVEPTSYADIKAAFETRHCRA